MVIVFSVSIWSQSSEWEKELFDSTKEESNQKPKSPKVNKDTIETDWEAELDKDLKDQETRSKSTEGSRGVTSNVQQPNQINRSAQNLMMDVSAAIDIVGAWDRNKPRVQANESITN